MNAIQKVRSVLDEIRSGKKRQNDAENWALVGRLLARLVPDPTAVGKAVAEKNLDGLIKMVDVIEGKAAAASKAPPPVADEDEMQRALAAFRKRIKVSRLADESRLGGRYTSGGRKSEIDAIQPPDGFSPVVWTALVAAGKLKELGKGFYSEP